MKTKIPSRPRAPQWKIFTAGGLYMGSLHDPTDAAAVISNYSEGAQVRFGRDPQDTVWTEGADGHAGDSFDLAVEKMLERLEKIRIRRRHEAREHRDRMRTHFP